MNSPKRKVTDLLPSEAILISSDADLKVLEEFEKVGIFWINGGEKHTQWKPFPRWEFPERIVLDNRRISRGSPHHYIEYPATDFIPTEAEKVEVDWKMIAEQLGAELEKVAEFFRTHNKPDNTFGSFVSKQIGFTEIAESVNQTLLKTRNPELRWKRKH